MTNAKNELDFKKRYFSTFEIKPQKCDTFGVRDRYGISLLTKIRVEFSDLRDHRFNHNFNCTNPVCKCDDDIESTEHFFAR